MEPGDERISGLFLDTYEIEAQAGQRIVADLRSMDFDTLLRILDPDGSGPENDDYGLETGHSHIEWLVLKDGTYSIRISIVAMRH